MFNLKFITLYLFLLAHEIVSAHKWPGVQQCTTPGLVALTFDDGPSLNGETENVLKILKEKNVKATFFVTGNYDKNVLLALDQNQEMQNLLRKTFNDGHQIGSHTWNHSRLTKLTTPEIREDVVRLEKTVQRVLGINMTVFRPPYSDSTEKIREFIKKEFSYEQVFWNLDTVDWDYKNTTKSFNKYKQKIGPSVKSNKTSFISIHHDPLPGSGELARMAIDFIHSKGYKLVTVGECIGVKDYVNV